MALSIAQMRAAMGHTGNQYDIQSIGANEAPDINPKPYFPPDPLMGKYIPPGGVAMPNGIPIGGVDRNQQQPGQQMMPGDSQQMPQGSEDDGSPGGPQAGQMAGGNQQAGQMAGPPGTQQQPGTQPTPGMGPTPPMGNMLSMMPQGQLMQSMGGDQPPGMAKGGSAKRTFAIQPAKVQSVKPEEFSPYNDQQVSIPHLSKAFDEAISHHLSLSPEDRVANSMRAAHAVAKHIGRTVKGEPKDLLGKNAKLLKAEKGYESEPVTLPDGRTIETTGLALAPSYQEGKFNTCPNSASCKDECLGKTSGKYFQLGGGTDLSAFEGPRLNSLMKTQAFLRDPHSFAVKLHDEIQSAKDMAAAGNSHLGIRFNVLSDINPRVHKSIIESHPDVTFYDYTKNNSDPIAPNHHYTYSSTGVSQPGVENPNTNWKQMRRRLDQGDNVSMAFTHKSHLPEEVHDQETGNKYKVVNGDTHDFRPLDMQPEGYKGVIVGLKNKKATGKMQEQHIDSHGFFVHYDPQEKMAMNKSGKPVFARDEIGNTTPQNRTVTIQPQKSSMKIKTNDGEEA